MKTEFVKSSLVHYTIRNQTPFTEWSKLKTINMKNHSLKLRDILFQLPRNCHSMIYDYPPPPHISLFYFCYLYKLYDLSISYLIWRVWCVYDNFVQMCWFFWQREVGLHKQQNHTIKVFCIDFFLSKSHIAKYIYWYS